MLPQRISLIYIVLLSLFLSSCEVSCTLGDKNTPEDTKTKPVKKDGALLYNGIQLQTTQVQVEKAYLVTNDDKAERIGDDNFIDVKRGVKIVIMIDDGWKALDEKVYLSGSMKVATTDGKVILDQPDLFDRVREEGISITDSKILSLTVNFTSWNTNEPLTLNVDFNIQDKNSEARIEGSYQVYTK